MEGSPRPTRSELSGDDGVLDPFEHTKGSDDDGVLDPFEHTKGSDDDGVLDPFEHTKAEDEDEDAGDDGEAPRGGERSEDEAPGAENEPEDEAGAGGSDADADSAVEKAEGEGDEAADSDAELADDGVDAGDFAPDVPADQVDEGAIDGALAQPTAAENAAPGFVSPTEEVEGAADLWEATLGRRPEDDQSLGDAALADMDEALSAKQIAMRDTGQSSLASLEAATEDAVADVRDAQSEAEMRLRARFSGAREKLDSKLGTTIDQLNQRVRDREATIDQKAETRKGELRKGIDAELKKLPGLEKKAIENPGKSLDGVIEGARKEQQRAVNEVLAMARSRAAAYEAREASGKKEAKRNEARANAAIEVGQDAAEEIREATQATIDDLESRRENLPAPNEKQAEAVREQLESLKERVANDIDESVEGKKKELRKQGRDLAKNLRTTARSIRRQLQRGEDQAVEMLEARGDAAQARVRAAGAGARAELAQIIAASVGALSERGYQVHQEAHDAGDIAPAETVQAAAGDVAQVSAADEAEVLPVLADAAARLRVGIFELGEQAAGGLLQSVDALSEQCDGGVEQFGGGLDGALEKATESLDEFVDDTDEGFGKIVGNAVTQAGKATKGFDEALDKQREEIEADMSGPVDTLRERLDEKLETLPGRICEAAEKAADEVKSWWKKALVNTVKIVAGVLVAVGTFVAVGAFFVGTLGVGPLAAAMIAGALAGIAAVLATDTAGALFGGERPHPFSGAYWKQNWKKVLVAGAMGAVGGAMGSLTSSLHPVATALSTGGVMSTLQQTFDVLVLGQSWSWSQWLLTFTLAGVSAGVGHGFKARGVEKGFMQRAFGNGRWGSLNKVLKTKSLEQRLAVYKIVKSTPTRTVDGAIDKTVEAIYEASPLADDGD